MILFGLAGGQKVGRFNLVFGYYWGTALMIRVGVLSSVTRGVWTACLSSLMGCGDYVRCIAVWSWVAF